MCDKVVKKWGYLIVNKKEKTLQKNYIIVATQIIMKMNLSMLLKILFLSTNLSPIKILYLVVEKSSYIVNSMII